MSGTDNPMCWIDIYVTDRLSLKRETTIQADTIILRQFLTWLKSQPGHESPFTPLQDLTQCAIQPGLLSFLPNTSSHHGN